MARELPRLRKEIDAIDRKLVELLAKRFGVIERVAQTKASEGLPARIPGRIRAVIERREKAGRGLGIPRKATARIWKAIVEESCLLEERLIGQSEAEENDMKKPKTSKKTAKKKAATKIAAKASKSAKKSKKAASKATKAKSKKITARKAAPKKKPATRKRKPVAVPAAPPSPPPAAAVQVAVPSPEQTAAPSPSPLPAVDPGEPESETAR
ncbi:chorismate mutase [Aestuariivirga sp.]|uniref:chorismate mutase n=1 Tax=Aestuariivirga sp. TaxID=2650926 RepID=UPI0039E24034